MTKVITQDAVDKAVAKAVAAETKRCLAVVKGVVFDDAMFGKAQRNAQKAIIAALKPVSVLRPATV